MIAGVPYDAEVEYLECNGGQYINTGIVPKNGDSVECEFYIHGSGGRYRCLWSAGTGTYQFIVLPDTHPTTNMVFCKYFASGQAQEIPLQSSRWLSIRCDGGGYFQIGDSSAQSSYESSLDGDETNLWLLRRRNNTQGFVGRIKSFRYYVGGHLALDLVPVRVGQTGYLYNRVTHMPMPTSGTGAFGLGPDVATPVMGLRRYPQIGGEA